MLYTLFRWMIAGGSPTEVRGRMPPDAPGRVDGDKLIHRVDVVVDASCPCGSTVIHHLTLISTADCRRCGRTIGVRSIEYHRRSPAAVPQPIISIGWIHSETHLRRSPTTGVH